MAGKRSWWVRQSSVRLIKYVCLGIDYIILYIVWKRLKRTRSDSHLVAHRRRKLKGKFFNVNKFSVEESLRLLRLRPCEMPMLNSLVQIYYRTDRHAYRCPPIHATCILLSRLEHQKVEIPLIFFGMTMQEMSEVFYDFLEEFNQRQGYPI